MCAQSSFFWCCMIIRYENWIDDVYYNDIINVCNVVVHVLYIRTGTNDRNEIMLYPRIIYIWAKSMCITFIVIGIANNQLKLCFSVHIILDRSVYEVRIRIYLFFKSRKFFFSLYGVSSIMVINFFELMKYYILLYFVYANFKPW